MSNKWQCSEQAAEAAYRLFKGSTTFESAADGMRAAITAALGPEIDRMRAELAEVRAALAERDGRRCEGCEHYCPHKAGGCGSRECRHPWHLESWLDRATAPDWHCADWRKREP